jgi:hypothetical protein
MPSRLASAQALVRTLLTLLLTHGLKPSLNWS